mmetsp:Transcript_25085/g.65419  ORF Transcript_25085/g.65419 Transcript_25085/m.65419 type:complete len:198 (-) Transcript_25085:173-766(-)
MPQKKTNKNGKNAKSKGKRDGAAREFVMKDDSGEQEYAEVIKPYGCNRFHLRCQDGVDRTGHVRGRMKTYIRPNDIVLVTIRPFGSGKEADIVMKYTDAEVGKLASLRKLHGIGGQSAAAGPARPGDDNDDFEICFGEEMAVNDGEDYTDWMGATLGPGLGNRTAAASDDSDNDESDAEGDVGMPHRGGMAVTIASP